MNSANQRLRDARGRFVKGGGKRSVGKGKRHRKPAARRHTWRAAPTRALKRRARKAVSRYGGTSRRAARAQYEFDHEIGEWSPERVAEDIVKAMNRRQLYSTYTDEGWRALQAELARLDRRHK